VSIPGGDLTLLRKAPQTSSLYLVIQQPQYSTDDGATWTGYDWSCRINGAHTDDPTVTLTVDGGAAATDLLDGMTVLVGSSYGAWDKGIYRLRGDQSVDGGTVALDIGTSSEVRDLVADDDYVVVLDEFRFWQRYGRIVIAGDAVWYKDYDIEWDDLGGTDAARRAAMMPPVPVMGPHAVKFVETDTDASQFYFDWQNSYATAPGEAIDTWTSVGETDHAGGTWNSAAETPGWQTVDAISGLRGFRVTLEVDDGNGNATTLPYRRGVRYVFSLRRPGETQVGDPPNAEPITEFELGEPPSGDFSQGYWRTSITVFASQAAEHNIMPGALVILFTEDTYGGTAGSLGPISDRENILLVGRIMDDSIRVDPETGDVTFDVASPGAETATYHNYPIVVQNDDNAATWIDTPDLTIDRAVHYYTTWHTNLNQIADLYQTGSATEILAQDFLEGDIYSTLNSFLYDRLFARLLCDKYGRFFCEVDAQMSAFGSTTTLWTMQQADWLDEVTARQRNVAPVNSVECGGLLYEIGRVVPYMSRSPGLFSKYRGAPQAATSLAITSQAALNTLAGRFLQALNYEFEIDFYLAGNWRYCDIAPQRVVDIGNLVTDRGTLTGDYIIRRVTNNFGVAGATIDIPEELPIPTRPHPTIPVRPGVPPFPGWPEPDDGRRIISTTIGVYVTDNIAATTPVWYQVNSGFVTANDAYVWAIARDPFHWWTSGGTESTLWCISKSGVWKHEDFPHGTWVQQISFAAFIAALGYAPDTTTELNHCRINMSIEDDGRYVVGINAPDKRGAFERWYASACVCTDAAINNVNEFAGYDTLTAGGRINGFAEVKFDPHSASQTIFCTPCKDPNNVANAQRDLYRSVNGGAAWAQVDGPYFFAASNKFGIISVPYQDLGNYVLWGSLLTHRVSSDGGATWADVPGVTALDTNSGGMSGYARRIFLATSDPSVTACRYTIDSGANWTLLSVGAGPADEGDCSWTFWQGDTLVSVLVCGEDGLGSDIQIFRYTGGGWSDKTGNLLSFGSHIEVTDVDRDSMGSA